MKYNHAQLREIILNNLDDVRLLTITKEQKDIIKFCSTEKTAVEVSEKYKKSIQSSGMALKKLFELGYLKRIRRYHFSGGIEYVYYAEKAR